MASRKESDLHLHRAFDVVQFGTANILNLRERLPTVADATHRAEAWLRQRQAENAGEVLVVTGRGRNSEGGVSPVREAFIRLIASLRRRGVVDRYQEHTAGSFAITLAPLSAMLNSPRRNRDRQPASVEDPRLDALSPAARTLLRELAVRSLDALGVKNSEAFVTAEMIRQLAAIRPAIVGAIDGDRALCTALRNALDESP